MNYLTVSCLTLVILTFNGLTHCQSATMVPNIMDAIDMETMMVDNLLMEKVKIDDTDIMKPMSDSPSSEIVVDEISLWNPKEAIPIYISKEQSQTNVKAIVGALNEIQSNSCLRFKNAEKEDKSKGVLVYQDGKSCFSFLGKQGGAQSIIFQNKACGYIGLAIHETMHALGFIHEHQRSDRDEFVKIIVENIEEDYVEQFRKYQHELIGPYDYYSIMQYASNAFAKQQNLTTIQPLKKGVKLRPVYAKTKLSKLDVEKLNKLYDCASLNRTDKPEPFVLKRKYK